MILIFFIILFQHAVATIFEFSEYTHVAKTFNGAPCLTGCNDRFECVINWDWHKANCRTFEIAPIYLTSRMKDPERKYCLSNCGYFGENYEWCITTDDLKWDYCSSEKSTSFLPSLAPVAHTRLGDSCTYECTRMPWDTRFYWCYFNKNGERKWEYCAPPPLPRVPVLRSDFYIGEKKKGSCDGLMKYVSTVTNSSSVTEAPDNFVLGLADAIEGSNIRNSFVQQFKVKDRTPIQSYALVKVRDLKVPIVIRAHITNETINMEDKPKISEEIERKLREQMTGSSSSYESVHLIGAQLGGPSTDYNIVPRSVNWRCEEWYNMELAVKNWCLTTGGSVDMTVVVFYKDEYTPIPSAFGVSLVYRNYDNSVFVDCREKVHYNTF